MTRGKLIVIEGIDGAGKGTQAGLLAHALQQRGIAFVTFSFPRYESSFGRLIAQFLNGDFGPLAAVDPHFSALLYAGDRLEAKPDLEGALNSGRAVVLDRYVASNLAHQAARMPAERRGEFVGWLRQLYDLEMPHFILGTLEAIVDMLRRRRDAYGFSFTIVPGDFAESFAPVVERLAGT